MPSRVKSLQAHSARTEGRGWSDFVPVTSFTGDPWHLCKKNPCHRQNLFIFFQKKKKLLRGWLIWLDLMGPCFLPVVPHTWRSTNQEPSPRCGKQCERRSTGQFSRTAISPMCLDLCDAFFSCFVVAARMRTPAGSSATREHKIPSPLLQHRLFQVSILRFRNSVPVLFKKESTCSHLMNLSLVPEATTAVRGKRRRWFSPELITIHHPHFLSSSNPTHKDIITVNCTLSEIFTSVYGFHIPLV